MEARVLGQSSLEKQRNDYMRCEIPKQILAFAYEMPHLPTLSADNPELKNMPDIACSKEDGLLKPIMHLKLDCYAFDVP